ncbi:MAG TPA: hypothetical protein VFC44_23585 [Candidatus Saccharimonadales bacterium]|nr:hypothetical protein [Candidatus Saccharimonadales bacterium]
MKTKSRGTALTLGGLIENFYNTWGKHRAPGLLQLALKSHLVVFRGPNRYVFSRGNGKE